MLECIDERSTLRPVLMTVLNVILILALAACGGDVQDDAAKVDDDSRQEDVLVRVNQEPITRDDLELAIRKAVGPEYASTLGDEERRKFLESLVTGKLMAQAALRELTAEQKARLERQVQSYRDQVLAQTYLAEHAPAAALTEAEVREYYNKYPERFGGGYVVEYEFLNTTDLLTDRNRAELLRKLSAATSRDDWQEYANQLKSEGFAVGYRQGTTAERLLDPRLRAKLAELNPGQVSQPMLINGRAYVLQALEKRERPPKPYAEVRPVIENALRAERAGNAVRSVGDELRKNAEIRYFMDSDSTDGNG